LERVHVNALADAPGVLCHLASAVFFKFKNKPDVVVAVPRCDVEMKMKDRLAGGPAVVRKDVETRGIEGLHERARNDLRRGNQVGKLLPRDVKKRFAVPFGKYKDVPEVNRIDVEDCDRVRITEQDFCRRLTAYYGTESAIRVCHIVLFEIITEYIENSPRSQSAA